jgi:hypothetical protein
VRRLTPAYAARCGSVPVGARQCPCSSEGGVWNIATCVLALSHEQESRPAEMPDSQAARVAVPREAGSLSAPGVVVSASRQEAARALLADACLDWATADYWGCRAIRTSHSLIRSSDRGRLRASCFQAANSVRARPHSSRLESDCRRAAKAFDRVMGDAFASWAIVTRSSPARSAWSAFSSAVAARSRPEASGPEAQELLGCRDQGGRRTTGSDHAQSELSCPHGVGQLRRECLRLVWMTGCCEVVDA